MLAAYSKYLKEMNKTADPGKKQRRRSHDDDVTEVIDIDADSDSSSDYRLARKQPASKRQNLKSSDESKPSTSQSTSAGTKATRNDANNDNSQILSDLAIFLIEDLHSVSMLKEPGFKKFVAKIRPDLELPSQDDLLNHILLLYGIEKSNLMDLLSRIDAISIAVERWTSFAENTYATIKANFINDEWEPQSYILSTVQINGTMKFTHLNDKVLEVAKGWDIENKIVSIVFDWYPDPPDIREVMFAATYQQLGSKIACFAIKLQSIIDSSLNSFDELKVLVEKCKRIVSYFQHNTTAEVFLHKYQNLLEIPRDQLFQSSSEEINSTYLMADRLLNQKMAVIASLRDTDATEPEIAAELQISDAEWIVLEELVAALKPFQLARVVLYRVKDHVDSISVVKPLIHSFCTNFLSTTAETSIIQSLKKLIQSELLQKFQLYTGNVEMNEPDYFDIATFLDPRYKNQEYLDARDRATIKNYIHDVYFAKNETKENRLTKSTVSFKALSILFPKSSTVTTEPDDECTRYFDEAEVNKALSTHEWWKIHERMYPVLSKIAKRHLCTHATSRSIFTTRNAALKRKNLSPQIVDKLIFLNHKLKFDEK